MLERYDMSLANKQIHVTFATVERERIKKRYLSEMDDFILRRYSQQIESEYIY